MTYASKKKKNQIRYEEPRITVALDSQYYTGNKKTIEH